MLTGYIQCGERFTDRESTVAMQTGTDSKQIRYTPTLLPVSPDGYFSTQATVRKPGKLGP